ENASSEQAVRLWNAKLPTSRFYALLRHDDYGYVQSATFSADGRTIVTSTGDRTYVWSTEPGGSIRTFDNTEDHAELSVDGQYVATETFAHDEAGENLHRIQVESVATGEKLGIVQAAGNLAFFAWALSPDNRLVAIAYDSEALIFTRDENAKPIAKLEGHTKIIRSIHFSSDGSRIVTSADD